MADFEKKTYALAALFTASAIIQDLAERDEMEGEHDTPYGTVINAVFNRFPEKTLEIYDREGLRTGYQILANPASVAQTRGARFLKYAENINEQTESCMSRSRKKLMDALGDDIDSLKADMDANGWDALDEHVTERLAGMYVSRISDHNTKIMIYGRHDLTPVMGKLRAALLAGIRASVLWHQLGGGSFFQLLMNRRKYTEEAARNI